MYGMVIRNGTIYDGTGAAPFAGDVAVADAQIVAVGSIDEAQVGPDAPLASFFGWHLGVFLQNPVYSLSIVASREGPEASLRLLEKHSIEALVFHRKKDPGDMYTNALGSMGFAGYSMPAMSSIACLSSGDAPFQV